MNKGEIINFIDLALKKRWEFEEKYEIPEDHFIRTLSELKSDILSNGVIRIKILRCFKFVFFDTIKHYEETEFCEPIMEIHSILKEFEVYRQLRASDSDCRDW